MRGRYGLGELDEIRHASLSTTFRVGDLVGVELLKLRGSSGLRITPTPILMNVPPGFASA